MQYKVITTAHSMLVTVTSHFTVVTVRESLIRLGNSSNMCVVWRTCRNICFTIVTL